MSLQEGAGTDVKGKESSQVARAVTDSVHGRFRPIRVHCDICDVDIIGRHIAIETHFNDSHTALRRCSYCKGKVFTYRRLFDGNDTSSKETSSEEFVYHKCRNSQDLPSSET